jgi:hypothetical protein
MRRSTKLHVEREAGFACMQTNHIHASGRVITALAYMRMATRKRGCLRLLGAFMDLDGRWHR